MRKWSVPTSIALAAVCALLKITPAMAQAPCPPALCIGECSPSQVQQTCEAPPANDPSGWLGVPQPPFGLTETSNSVVGQCGNYQGTADNPVVVTVNTQECTISGSYVILENSDVQQLDLDGDHLAVRNSHIHGASKGAMVWVNGGSTDIVIYNNEVDHNGTIPSSKDNHGIGLAGNTDRVWILDNLIHENSGDGIQFCHGCIGSGQGPLTVYISGNVIHDDEENAMDFKEFQGPLIITENEMYGYEPGEFSGHGEALRINDEGSQGEMWIVANYFHDNRQDINPQGSDAESYILDNDGRQPSKEGDVVVVATGSAADQYYDLYEQKYGISIRP